jgi:hypothetical protein
MFLKLLTSFLALASVQGARPITLNLYQAPPLPPQSSFECFECKMTVNYLSHIDYTKVGKEFCETLPKEHYDTCEFYVEKYAPDINAYLNDTDSLCREIDLC